MNDLLAQVYGTDRLVGSAMSKTAEAEILSDIEELEKVAAENGIQLDTISDEDILEILGQLKASREAGVVDEAPVAKTAAAAPTAPAQEQPDEEQVKLAEADFLGRAMAHAFYQELSSIGQAVEKNASAEVEVGAVDEFEAAATAKAEQLLQLAHDRLQTKQASAKNKLAAAVASKHKVASEGDAEEAVIMRALQMLDAADFNVQQIIDLASEEG